MTPRRLRLLKARQLYGNRDLKPTADLRAAPKGVSADHLGLSVALLGETVSAVSARIAPFKGLIAGVRPPSFNLTGELALKMSERLWRDIS